MTEASTAPARSRKAALRRGALIVLVINLLGIISGMLGDSGYGNPWFARLAKPEIMPPGWVFGLVWTSLYTLMGVALAIIVAARDARARNVAIALFAIQLTLNLAWAPIFFALHRIMLGFGLIIAIFFWATATTVLFWRIRRLAGLLLLPYLAWLVFAGYLNWQFHELNPWGPALVSTSGNTQIIVQ